MTLAKLTPQQAATRAKVSRGTIMNAIKDGSLPAMRDNRNRWQIHPDKLASWLADRDDNDTDNATGNAAKPDSQEPSTTPEKDIRIAVLEVELKAKDQRIADLERDRDSWKEQAQQLARPRRWWPF
ncbi:MAG: helix-turn-helix domain-containing protein [Alphaproteobacteria bacterium]|jgi:excisionase family DNA binding protein|nr:helix-turn-helix domain-containing protein [Alphaproteobacteria bacterium]HBS99285.1 hypothetical protein [Citreicella sp.]|tara:strand:- start:36 stop:413 length:378 start_codon:yes stop_codon:yes gene_type:complete